MEKSLFERRNSGKPRIHSELTEESRHRFKAVSEQINSGSHAPTYQKVSRKIGEGHLDETNLEIDYGPRAIEKQRRHGDVIRDILVDEDTVIALSTLEMLINEAYKHYQDARSRDESEIENFTQEVKSILETEGILWELEEEDGRYKFKELGGSERAAKSDQEYRELVAGSEFESAFKSYNEAVRLFRERHYDDTIPKKLYNAIEETAKTICVDLEGWKDNRDLNLSEYLEEMKKRGIFSPNEIMKSELEEIAQGMFKTFHKAGNDRKNRHRNIDREYSNLLIHQTSALLTYTVRNYKQKFRKGG